MPHALVIEDSREYQLLVRSALKESFDVTCAEDATQALNALQKEHFDLILIDVGLPGRDGLALCEDLRREPKLKDTPILFVTGRTEPKDLVQGFAVGADDYIYKPFHPDELRARVDARMRRATVPVAVSDAFAKGQLKFIVGQQRVVQKDAMTGAERDLELTPNEFKILYHLAKHEGQTLSRSNILKEVWGEHLHVVERTVDKHICAVRRKMGTESRAITSVSGEGYVFRTVGPKTNAKAQ